MLSQSWREVNAGLSSVKGLFARRRRSAPPRGKRDGSHPLGARQGEDPRAAEADDRRPAEVRRPHVPSGRDPARGRAREVGSHSLIRTAVAAQSRRRVGPGRLAAEERKRLSVRHDRPFRSPTSAASMDALAISARTQLPCASLQPSCLGWAAAAPSPEPLAAKRRMGSGSLRQFAWRS
jgi:hypothetical protein